MFVLVRWFWRPGSSRVAVLCFVRSVIDLLPVLEFVSWIEGDVCFGAVVLAARQ